MLKKVFGIDHKENDLNKGKKDYINKEVLRRRDSGKIFPYSSAYKKGG